MATSPFLLSRFVPARGGTFEENEIYEKVEERKRLEREVKEMAVAKKGWKISIATLSCLNTISDDNYRKKALDYVKKHRLTTGGTLTLSRIANRDYDDVFNAILSEKINLIADLSAGHFFLIIQLEEYERRKRLISDMKAISNTYHGSVSSPENETKPRWPS